MQLTNIARDVADAAAGRLYLPAAWLREEGVDPAAFLRDPQPLPGVARVVLRLLDAADVLYVRADAGIAALPADVQPAIYAARFIYADIGRVIRARGGDSVTGRAVVPGSRKAALLGRALMQRSGPRRAPRCSSRRPPRCNSSSMRSRVRTMGDGSSNPLAEERRVHGLVRGSREGPRPSNRAAASSCAASRAPATS